MELILIRFLYVVVSRRYLPVLCFHFLRDRCQQLFRQTVEFGGDAHCRSGWEKTKEKGYGGRVDSGIDEISLLSDVVILTQHLHPIFLPGHPPLLYTAVPGAASLVNPMT